MPAPDDGTLVRVAVDAQADRPERTFTYRLGPRTTPEPGSLVLVPYGGRLALGYLLAGQPDPVDAPLPVESVVSDPLLTADLLVLAEAIAIRYRAPIGTTLAAMLPPGLESRLERRWEVLEPAALRAADAGDGEAGDGELGVGTLLTERQLRRLADDVSPRWLEGRRRAGALRAAWRLRPPAAGPRRVRVVRRRRSPGKPVSGPLQRALLDAVGPGEATTLPELGARLGRAASALLSPARRLEAAGWVELEWLTTRRDPLSHRPPGQTAAADMAPEQVAAIRAIADLAPGGELLLEGVAASGKTDVILASVDATLAAGRDAIVLVPEVTLIPQLADRLHGTAGAALSVLHSGLSAGERHDEWIRIMGGEAGVVVGTRSAIFAPLRNLGLVVLDEAHDTGYKADRTPRYDTRWVAGQRAALTGARVVQASATPDVVSVYRVRTGAARRVRLATRRVGAAPQVTIVDMRAELAAGNRSVLSETLTDGLARLTAGRQQAILLINRRGAATFVLCRDCGEPLRCPECLMPLVHHLATAELRCHHDGRTAVLPSRCPNCNSPRIRYFGAGTQRVEAEVRSRFPQLRVGRLDSDAVAARRRFESIYDDFVAGRIDVLVGTQLAAKGLDLPSVTLAGVVAADVTLHLPDYLAAERTFQLLAQVAGRAGRGPLSGQVVIQTYAPDHPAIRAASRLDVDAFVDGELPRREAFGYPPFGWLARLLVADADRRRGEVRAETAASAVAGPGVDVLGPVPAWVPRRAGRWRWQVVVRAATEDARAAALERAPAGIGIDVDPGSLL
ncbi:MAG TPA: primosomal protein N' [Candidatus Limnocylindria bacterium]